MPRATLVYVEGANPAPDSTSHTTGEDVRIVDAQQTPSKPWRLEGRDAIAAPYADVLARDVRHDVEHVAIGGDTIAYSVRCTYPDGARVVCVTTARRQDGRIAEQIVAQAWDNRPTRASEPRCRARGNPRAPTAAVKHPPLTVAHPPLQRRRRPAGQTTPLRRLAGGGGM